MFPEAEARETLRFEGNKIKCFPRDQSLSDLLYSGTPLYGHPLNTDTRILRTVSFVPTKLSYIFSKINPLNTDTS